MITKNDLNTLYKWGKQNNFPLKKAPTSNGYSNKDIYISWLKGVGKMSTIRKKMMTEEIFNIISNDEILYATYSIFDSGTILNPHKDPNLYKEPYKRIQIPLEIPQREKCYMIWEGKKIFWEKGLAQVYEVMDYIHEGANLSDFPMKFLFLDVKKDCIVDI